jgi:hypothetical protein
MPPFVLPNAASLLLRTVTIGEFMAQFSLDKDTLFD